MHCSSCEKAYCESCITNRYDFDFKGTSTAWTCPVCLDYCNCDKCMERRGTRESFKSKFKKAGYSTANVLKRKTGHSLQTWLRQNGFTAEGGPTPGPKAASVDDDEDPEVDMDAEDEDDDVVMISSEDGDGEDEVMGERNAVLTSPESTPEPNNMEVESLDSPITTPPHFSAEDAQMEEALPLFLPDSPELGLLGLASSRPASEDYVSDSTMLTTPGSSSTLNAPVPGPASPLQSKSFAVDPVFVPDTNYYNDISDGIWSGNGYSSFPDDLLDVANLSRLHQSPPRDFSATTYLDNYLPDSIVPY